MYIYLFLLFPLSDLIWKYIRVSNFSNFFSRINGLTSFNQLLIIFSNKEKFWPKKRLMLRIFLRYNFLAKWTFYEFFKKKFCLFFSKEVQLAVSVGGKMVNWSMVVSKKLSLESLEIPWKLKVSTDNIATLNLHVLATTITALKLCPNPSSLISTVSILSIVNGSSGIIWVFGQSSGTKKVRFSAQCIGKQNRGVNLLCAPLVVEYT